MAEQAELAASHVLNATKDVLADLREQIVEASIELEGVSSKLAERKAELAATVGHSLRQRDPQLLWDFIGERGGRRGPSERSRICGRGVPRMAEAGTRTASRQPAEGKRVAATEGDPSLSQSSVFRALCRGSRSRNPERSARQPKPNSARRRRRWSSSTRIWPPSAQS